MILLTTFIIAKFLLLVQVSVPLLSLASPFLNTAKRSSSASSVHHAYLASQLSFHSFLNMTLRQVVFHLNSLPVKIESRRKGPRLVVNGKTYDATQPWVPRALLGSFVPIEKIEGPEYSDAEKKELFQQMQEYWLYQCLPYWLATQETSYFSEDISRPVMSHVRHNFYPRHKTIEALKAPIEPLLEEPAPYNVPVRTVRPHDPLFHREIEAKNPSNPPLEASVLTGTNNFTNSTCLVPPCLMSVEVKVDAKTILKNQDGKGTVLAYPTARVMEGRFIAFCVIILLLFLIVSIIAWLCCYGRRRSQEQLAREKLSGKEKTVSVSAPCRKDQLSESSLFVFLDPRTPKRSRGSECVVGKDGNNSEEEEEESTPSRSSTSWSKRLKDFILCRKLKKSSNSSDESRQPLLDSQNCEIDNGVNIPRHSKSDTVSLSRTNKTFDVSQERKSHLHFTPFEDDKHNENRVTGSPRFALHDGGKMKRNSDQNCDTAVKMNAKSPVQTLPEEDQHSRCGHGCTDVSDQYDDSLVDLLDLAQRNRKEVTPASNNEYGRIDRNDCRTERATEDKRRLLEHVGIPRNPSYKRHVPENVASGEVEPLLCTEMKPATNSEYGRIDRNDSRTEREKEDKRRLLLGNPRTLGCRRHVPENVASGEVEPLLCTKMNVDSPTGAALVRKALERGWYDKRRGVIVFCESDSDPDDT